MVLQAERLYLLTQIVFVFTMFTDDDSFDGNAAVVQDATSLDQNIKAFLWNKATNSKCSKRRWRTWWLFCLIQETGKLCVQAVIETVDRSFRIYRLKMFAIRTGAGNDKLGCAHFSFQETCGIQRFAIDVFCMGGEGERKTCK
jgi:hypothetical protein